MDTGAAFDEADYQAVSCFAGKIHKLATSLRLEQLMPAEGEMTFGTTGNGAPVPQNRRSPWKSLRSLSGDRLQLSRHVI
jgi:hypothetical protein